MLGRAGSGGCCVTKEAKIRDSRPFVNIPFSNFSVESELVFVPGRDQNLYSYIRGGRISSTGPVHIDATRTSL